MKAAMLIPGLLTLAGCMTMPPMPGKLVDVDGHKMHLYCSGPENSATTVVIEGGLSGVSPFYSRLQQSLEKQIKTCTYDRAGLGWSEPSASSRDANQIAAELHALLHGAGVKPPYVLAGHSLGGLIVLRYQHDYAEDVAGLAFLDASFPTQTWDAKQMVKPYRLGSIAAALGITHLYNPSRSWFENLPAEPRAQSLYFSNQSRIYRTTMAEIRGFNESSKQAAEVKTLGDLPLVVITAGRQCVDDPKITEERHAKCVEFANEWTRHHEEMAAMSRRGRHITLSQATHLTLVTEQQNAEQVAHEIMGVVKQGQP